MYRQQYFLVLDEVVNEINRRFDQENLNIVIDIEKLLLKCSNDKQADICIPDSLTTTYQKDINFEQLKLQLQLIPGLILRYKELTGITIKKVTNIRTVCEVLNSNPVSKRMCPDLHSLLKVYLTIPAYDN